MRPSQSGPPHTLSSSLPNIKTQLQLDACPVKDTPSARKYLDEHGWNLSSEPFSPKKLADILLSLSFSDKTLSKDTKSVIRAMACTLQDKYNDSIIEALTAKITDGLAAPVETALKPLGESTNFIKSTSDAQAAETLKLIDTTNTLSSLTQDTTTSITELHTLTSLLPNLTNAHINLTSSASKLTDLAKELSTVTNSLQSIPAHSSATPHTPFHHHSYAAILANPPQPTTHAPSPLVTPEHILHIENRLRLQERQIYITLDSDTIILYADRRRTEAIELQMKLNNELSTLEASCPSPESRHTVIRALQYTDHNALLIEFDTPDSAKAFRSYCTLSNFLSHISPAAKILPRVFRIIMKFVPCDGSFVPKDENQLRIIEKDHNLEEGSIISDNWIKKPLQRTPNQKTAHIRFLCALPTIANKLLSGHVFLANTLICVQKDLQEPIRCNICQEYGHIRNS